MFKQAITLLAAASILLAAGCTQQPANPATMENDSVSQAASLNMQIDSSSVQPELPPKPAPKEPVLPSELIQTEYSLPVTVLAETYPVGTTAIEIEVVNNGDSAVTYTGYYDFRTEINGELTMLKVRDDVEFDMQEHLLEPGETMRQTIPIDLFETPLTPGTYRFAQLVCFIGSEQGAPACSEFTAEFQIV